MRAEGPGSGLRILVVEDQGPVAESLADALRALGFELSDVLHDGREALLSARRDPPDLVFMDVDLPGRLDGIETAEALRNGHPELPIVFLSGRTDDETLGRAARAGGYGYLVKPPTRGRLKAAVRTALGIRRRETGADRAVPVPTGAPVSGAGPWRDPITGLVGRRQLEAQAEKILAFAERREASVAVVVLDLARFGHVNASLGYDVGDRALSRVAERLRNRVRESDVLARMGGDEFVVLMTDVDGTAGAAAGARRVVSALDEPVHLSDVSLQLTIDAGVALFPRHGRDIDALVRAASRALHGPAGNGRRISIFERSPEASGGEVAIAAELQRALEEDELAVHYQPIFRVPDGRVAGMEALVRWNHPERGTLSAGAFVPQAEDMRIVRQIDDWMLERVTADLRQWPGDRRPAWMSVNLSAESVRDPALPARMEELLGTTSRGNGGPFGDSRLVVEITERSAVRDFTAVRDVLSQLGELGIVAALDDFGTGHSSLVYLDRLPVEFLKLDRRFLRSVDDAGDGERLTTAILELGRALEIKVIAEGVERTQQYRWLQRHEVDLVQGYLTGKPVPKEALLA